MKRKIAKLWVEALRSGQYQQGTGSLRNYDNEFCCLGVLCNLHANAHPKIASKEKDKMHYLDKESNLPDEVRKWAEMQDVNGAKLPGIGWLVDLNDSKKFSFADIADVIEKHWQRL